MSNSSKHNVIRLPHAVDKGASSIADGSHRRQRVALILRTLVERDVVPRLLAGAPAAAALLAGLVEPGAAQTAAGLPPSEGLTGEDIETFSGLLLTGAAADIGVFVRRMREAGIAVDVLCLQLLAGAARHLGDLWAADRVTFTDVTVATGQLQRLFRELAPELPAPAAAEPPVVGTAMLAPVPGEQHSLGLSMLSAFFRRAGWTVSTPDIRNAAAMQRRVSSSPVDLLGLSMGAEIHLGELRRCIERARRSARTDLIVMVGGPLFVETPGLATAVGADATASDAVGALALAERLLRAKRAQLPSLAPAGPSA